MSSSAAAAPVAASHGAPRPVSRWKAASIHLACSALTAVIVATLVFGVWFPPPYFHAAGGDRLIMLLIGIDLVAGPLLTLIVFKAGKKGMTFDLAFIATVQAAALVYGLSVITSSRPVFLVGVIDRFMVVPAHELSDADLARAPVPSMRAKSWTGPQIVGARLPTDPNERNAVLDSSLKGRDLEMFPQYYVRIEDVQDSLRARAKKLADLVAMNPDRNGPVVRQVLADVAVDEATLGWVPLVTGRNDITMLVDLRTGAPLRPIDLPPWPGE